MPRLAFLFESPNKSRWKRLRQQSRPATKAEAGTEDLVASRPLCRLRRVNPGKGVQEAVSEDDTVEATRGAIN
jgi:hypothetical protein